MLNPKPKLRVTADSFVTEFIDYVNTVLPLSEEQRRGLNRDTILEYLEVYFDDMHGQVKRKFDL